MKIENEVTIVMTSYLNHDFTLASIWSIFENYPNIEIIIADGSNPEDGQVLLNKLITHFELKWIQVRFINCPGAPTEDCRNSAMALVKTPYVLFMDNDTKILDDSAIPMLVETIQTQPYVQTGAYGVVVYDWKKRRAYVGTNFVKHILLDAAPAYFSLHQTHAFMNVGGMPKAWFYPIPDKIWHDSVGKPLWQPGYSGDFSITKLYKELGWKCISPNQKVPVLHWGKTVRHFKKDPVMDWWYKNVKHIRLDPFEPPEDL